MNEKLLKIKMLEYDDTQTSLAEALGITQSLLSWKIKGKKHFKQPEIQKIINRYKLTPEQTQKIFFNYKGGEIDCSV